MKFDAQLVREEIELNGFAILPGVFTGQKIRAVIEAIGKNINTYAKRNILEIAPIRDLSGSPEMLSLIQSVLGPKAFPVRGIFFDKTPEANWKVPWHQDLSIAVERKIEVPGFDVWSEKEGVPHVQPPISILERMLTARIHLDDCGEENGALQVIAGSHRNGRLCNEEIQKWKATTASTGCVVASGGVLLMRPLLLHSSSVARLPKHRRVVHIEFASDDLPSGLKWWEKKKARI